jgi:hypothetical protein
MYFTDLNPIFATGIVVECFYRDELEEDEEEEDFTDLTSLGNEKLNNNIIPFKSIIINETSPRIIRGDSKYSISKNRDTSSINRTSKTFKHNSKKSKKSTSRNPKK